MREDADATTGRWLREAGDRSGRIESEQRKMAAPSVFAEPDDLRARSDLLSVGLMPMAMDHESRLRLMHCSAEQATRLVHLLSNIPRNADHLPL